MASESERNCEVRKQSDRLHALMVVTVQIGVHDLICRRCNKVTYFDGRDEGIYAATKVTLYLRELLDV